MGLPSYKLNNSYTVYVNYHYLNQCIQAGKKHTQKQKELADVARRARTALKSPNVTTNCKSNLSNNTTKGHSNKRDDHKNTIDIGSTVSLLNLNTNQQCTLVLTQSESIAIEANKISCASPVGSALLHKTVGDRITVNVPAGLVRYQVISFTH